MSLALSTTVAITMPDGIYILGGQNKAGQSLKQVQRFDTKNHSLHQVASMRVARSDFRACSSSSCDYIYVLGGSNSENGELSDIVERYNV